MGVKIYKNVVDNIMLIITPLNSILSSSKEENVLALLKYQDSFIAYTIFESCLSCAVLPNSYFEFQHFSMDCELSYQYLYSSSNLS